MTKANIWRFVRALLGFLVAFFLIRFVVISSGIDVLETWKQVDKRFLLLAFVCIGVGMLIASYRWYRLLNYIDVRLSFGVVIRLALIGQFFNLFVPGGVGGDLIKMVYLKSESKERYPEAVLTVFLDRLLGLAGLLLLALVALALNPSVLSQSVPEVRAILAVVGLAGAGGLLLTILFLCWPLLSRFSKQIEPLVERIPPVIKGVLERVLAAVSLLRSSPSAVLTYLFLAMVGHLCATFAVMAIGLGLGGVNGISFQAFLLTTQLSNLVGAVPLTPGGLGGRDLTMAYLLKESGAADMAAGAVPLVVTTLLITWSCIGGLALLWEKKSKVTSEVDDPGV